MPLIDHKTIDLVYQAMDIVEVVEEFVTLRKAGANYKGLCPFHDEKTPSFIVTPAKGICHCFGCHKGGNAINFLMQLNNWDYPETIRWLARKYNIEIIEAEGDPIMRQNMRHKEDLYALNQWANIFFQKNLLNTTEGQAIGLAYLRSRGIRDDIIHKFQLGYSPSTRNELYKTALENKFTKEHLTEVGLCIQPEHSSPYDRFTGRVIFPVHNYLGKVVAFGGRILQKKENVGKYVNSPESLIYNKSKELYGLFFARNAIQKLDCCYLVEGYTDVISMHQCGIENVVASSGTALTHDQIRLIKKYTTNLTVLYDGDLAGIKASIRGIDMLLEHGLNIKVLLLPDGHDPDSFAKEHSAKDFVDYINRNQVDFIRFKTKLLLNPSDTDIQNRSLVINGIADSISRIDNPITRSLYITECANLTQVREEDLVEAVNNSRNKLSLQKIKETQIQARTTNVRQIAPPQGQQPTSHKNISAQDNAELKLMKYIVRFGELPVATSDSNKNISFAEYIKNLMNSDAVTLKSTLYTEIIEELIQRNSLPNFKATTYLLSHPNDDIRNLALALSTDKDITISTDEKSITNHLQSNAEKLVVNIEIAILEDKINSINQDIHQHTLSDSEILHKLKEVQELKQAQVLLKKGIL